jgi:hypothetical protein
VRWFRRHGETLNEKLLREAGLATPDNLPEAEPVAAPDFEPPGPAEPGAQPLRTGRWQERAAEWDAVVSAEAPGLHGDRFDFATVPDGSVIVDETVSDDLSDLADAVERELGPPYRAVAVRQSETVWAVSARRIRVVEAGYERADSLELSSVGGERTFRAGGREADPAGAPVGLVELGESVGADYAVRAERLDGDLWEATAEPL